METIKNKLSTTLYYWLILVISLIALFILPLMNSEIDINNGIPNSTVEWITWSLSRVCVSALNVLIFHCFIKQGDLNTAKNEIRLNAEEELCINTSKKEYIPKSPKQFFTKEYCSKIPSILITTALSLVAFGPIILNFDLDTFVVYLLVIIMGIIFGIIEMKRVEDYYLKELPQYVKYIKEKNNV